MKDGIVKQTKNNSKAPPPHSFPMFCSPLLIRFRSWPTTALIFATERHFCTLWLYFSIRNYHNHHLTLRGPWNWHTVIKYPTKETDSEYTVQPSASTLRVGLIQVTQLQYRILSWMAILTVHMSTADVDYHAASTLPVQDIFLASALLTITTKRRMS